MTFTDKAIDGLRDKIKQRMSARRFEHTAEVEKMAARLGELYAPDKLDVLRVAALLHDVTKELDTEAQLELLKAYGESVREEDAMSPKTLHARTAALLVPDEFPEFASEEVLSAVRWHTTGRADMTLCDMLIYLADYIDMSRKFTDCVMLREYFWREDVQNMSFNERERHLWHTLVLSFDMTLSALVKEGAPISVDTLNARNALILKLSK